VIFRQRRYGLDGEEIAVYKFRTMTVMEDGDSVRQCARADERRGGTSGVNARSRERVAALEQALERRRSRGL
jgi:sugar transferase